jgi:hypothetical protein
MELKHYVNIVYMSSSVSKNFPGLCYEEMKSEIQRYAILLEMRRPCVARDMRFS